MADKMSERDSTRREILESIEFEYRRYKGFADGAMAQLDDGELITVVGTSSNSIAGIARHVAGNLTSRFTDFLTSDGEKPWRHRDREFDPGRPSREEVVEYWEKGWGILFESLSGLTDDDLDREVTIRGIGLSVRAALLRSLSHAAYHVGQIVFVAKSLRGPDWDYLTIPPGGSEAYNRNPTLE